MNYKVTTLTLTPYTDDAADILCAMLGEVGYDSFETDEPTVKAYIQAEQYSEENLNAVIASVFLPDLNISYEVADMENIDWNAEWEQQSFDPVLEREFGIRLDPRMAFGSGNHATTYQLVSHIMQMDFSGQSVLDMGCGTGVLGIAMAKRGAQHVIAIDIDDMSVENTELNFSLNQLSHLLTAIHGDATSISGSFCTIVANIHLNIILRDMEVYLNHLADGGTLILSGFYSSDAQQIISQAERFGLTHSNTFINDDWAMVIVRK